MFAGIFKDVRGLANQERDAALRLGQSFEEARNRHLVTPRERRIADGSRRFELNAANPQARVLWGNALWTEFSKHFDLTDEESWPNIPLYWITLVDVGCMTQLDVNVDAVDFAQRLSEGLCCLSYLGMVDAGLYTNIQPGTAFPYRKGINWHLHLFAWGESWEVMKERIVAMNKRDDLYRPIVASQYGALAQRESGRTLHTRFAYMAGTPSDAYRIGKRSNRDAFKQNKDELRHGERVTLFNALKNQFMHEITVAGGEGEKLTRRALRKIDLLASVRNRVL
jgi:hypothetical protein